MQDAITEKALRDTGLAATMVLIEQVCTDNLTAAFSEAEAQPSRGSDRVATEIAVRQSAIDL
jgi:hypothetical protein